MNIVKALSIALLMALLPCGAEAVKLDGRISAAWFNQDDDVSEQDYNMYSTNLRLKASDIMGGKTTVNFDGRARQAARRDINKQIPDYRITSANIEIANLFKNTDVAFGRHYVRDVPGARVDGLSLRMNLSPKYGCGLFGGAQPDPYKDTFSSDYSIYGAYGFLRDSLSKFSLGYVSQLYKGGEDSSYIYGSGNFRPNNKLMTYASIRSDHAVEGSGYELTNFLFTVNYKLSRHSRITATYNQYRAVKLYRSMDYNPRRELQRAYRIYADYGVTRTIKVYGQFDQRQRDGDKKTATLYLAGIRPTNLWKGTFADFSYRSIRYFTSKVTQYYASVGINPGMSTSLRFDITQSKNRQDDAPNEMKQQIYGFSIDWYGLKNFYLTGRYEESKQEYLAVESIFTAQRNDFKTRSTYFSAGYRF